MKSKHAMAFGAECQESGVRFRLWAPEAKTVEVCTENEIVPLASESGGWFQLTTDWARAGTRYRFRIDGEMQVPDPASRYQPTDVHGPSEVIDPASFDWQDEHWTGRAWEDAVIYELHVGTFTKAGTFSAIEQRLDYLVDLGINIIELMPVADFPGARNWGYDGVLPFAPDSSYGRPDDLKHLVNAAHGKGLMVLLDVVYNHFGPEGNYLHRYAPQFFTHRHRTPWGDAINFDGLCSRTVRDFFIQNALYWLEEYHFDGLRLDAVHAIVDDHEPHILVELAATVRAKFRGGRTVHLILENDNNAASMLVRDAKGLPKRYDAQWNDDMHHAIHVLITGESDGYYSDYVNEPVRRLGKCLAEGFAYQGEASPYRGGEHRGEPSAYLPPSAFVLFLENHDQIGNRALGERLIELAPTQALQAATCIVLLAPSPPMLFMGEEFGARTPFLFFCDLGADLAEAVTQGRREEFGKFGPFSTPESREIIPDPSSEATFLRSKLDWASLDEDEHRDWLRFYRELFHARAAKIAPLLRDKTEIKRGYEVLGKGALTGWWKFANAKLTVTANLGPQAIAAKQISGRRIFSVGYSGAANREIPPYSAAWFLDE
jgi:maltooligosyltrehalose trehalohydrolase